MTESEQRAIGRLEARVESLEATLREVRDDVKTLTSLVEQGKGARWAVGIVGAIGGSLASAAVWLLSVVRGG